MPLSSFDEIQNPQLRPIWDEVGDFEFNDLRL